MRIVHFTQGQSSANLDDSDSFPISNLRSPFFLKKFFADVLPDVIDRNLVVSIIALSINELIIAFIHLCRELQIPVVWNGPIRNLSSRERNLILFVDSSCKFPDIPPSDFHVVPIVDGCENQQGVCLEKLPDSNLWGIVHYGFFLKNWSKFTRLSLPKQNYLIAKFQMIGNQYLFYDSLSMVLLYYTAMSKIPSVQQYLDLACLAMGKIDPTSSNLLLYGPVTEHEVIQFLQIGFQTSIVSKKLEKEKISVVLSNSKGVFEYHVLNSEKLCTCGVFDCFGKLVAFSENTIVTKRYGILPMLQRNGILFPSNRLPNPRNLLESLLYQNDSFQKYELSQLGNDILRYGLPPRIYLKILRIFEQRGFSDNPRAIVDRVASQIGLSPWQIFPNPDYLGRKVIYLLKQLSFKFGFRESFHLFTKSLES